MYYYVQVIHTELSFDVFKNQVRACYSLRDTHKLIMMVSIEHLCPVDFSEIIALRLAIGVGKKCTLLGVQKRFWSSLKEDP